MYVYLGFVTMATVSLFAKPIKRGVGALKRRLAKASDKKNKTLRKNLNMLSNEAYKEVIHDRDVSSF